MYYHRKIIISGKYIELYEYEKTLRRDFTRTKKKRPDPVQEELDARIDPEPSAESKQMKKRKDSISRTRTEIRRLINCNQDFTKFYTLTFKDNITDVKIANKHFSKFIMRMEYRYEDFKYVSVIEFQKRGAVHYHFLCNLPYIKSKEVETIWGFGFIKIKRIQHVTNLGAYVCKYLQKDMTDGRLFNKKKYFCSKNLDRPTEIYDDQIVGQLIAQYGLESAAVEYESTFSGEYTGKVEYKQFLLEGIDA